MFNVFSDLYSVEVNSIQDLKMEDFKKDWKASLKFCFETCNVPSLYIIIDQ